jgi:LacI family transcriptional regulator
VSRKTSIADVAKLAGVSRTTVSYVLNNVTEVHISEATRQRVMDAAHQLDYHPNAMARSLARQQSLTLALILRASPSRLSADAFLPAVIYGITSVTSHAGFKLLIDAAEDTAQPNSYINLARQAHTDGIILAGSFGDDEALRQLNAEQFPVALWGQHPDIDLPSVDVDNVSAAQSAVEHLIRLGHRRIACITNAPLPSPESNARLRGYRTALQAHQLPVDESLIAFGDYQERSGFEAMRSLLSLPERPTAVFVASDEVAWGALRAARWAGVRVPQDLAVVGFDDIHLSEYMVPALTTVRVPAREIGVTLARMVLAMVQTGQRPPSVLLETELVVRESCGASLTNHV